MKKIIISSSFIIGLALSSNGYTLDEHTINREGVAEFSLSRTAVTLYDPLDATVATCIALPDTWSEPSSASITGNHQVETESTAFSAMLSRYSAGETVITEMQGLAAYTWYCYQDTGRSYVEGDVSQVTFTLATEDVNSTIYSSTGFIEGIPSFMSTDEYYFQNVSSHQILRDRQAADYFQEITAEYKSEGINPYEDSYDIIEVAGTTYFLGSNGQSFSLDTAGSIQTYVTPDSSNGYYINDQFIFLIYDSSNSATLEIQFGSSLTSLSEIFDISTVGKSARSLSFDTTTNDYVLLNTGSSAGQTKAYYTSPDLKTWTENAVGIYQNNKVVFADDGRAIMKNSSTAAPLMSRISNGDWQDFSHYPVGERFFAKEILLNDNRFHILLIEYSSDGNSTFLSFRLGYSDDLTSWNWTTIIPVVDQGTPSPSLLALNSNQLAIINNSVFYLSSDKAESWSSEISPLASIPLDSSVTTGSLGLQVGSIMSVNDNSDAQLIGTATLYSGGEKLSDFMFSTQSGSQFSLLHQAENPTVFIHNNDLYFYEGNWIDWAMYIKTKADVTEEEPVVEEEPAEVEESNPSSNSSGGGLFWSLLLLAGISIRRRSVQ